MIVLKKHRLYALFAFLIISSVNLTQVAASDSLFNRGWAAASDLGSKISQSPYTYHALAPAALYAGTQLGSLALKAPSYVTQNPRMLMIPAALTALAAYYAPSLALTESMRKQRESVAKNERPDKAHYFGPALLQGTLLAGYFAKQLYEGKSTYSAAVPSLMLALMTNPGLLSGLWSRSKEQDYEWYETEREKGRKAKEEVRRKEEEWDRNWENRWKQGEEQRRKWEEDLKRKADEGVQYEPQGNVDDWYRALDLKQADQKRLTQEDQIKNVKDAFRKLAKIHHPDKHPDNQAEAEKKFKEINDAYHGLIPHIIQNRPRTF